MRDWKDLQLLRRQTYVEAGRSAIKARWCAVTPWTNWAPQRIELSLTDTHIYGSGVVAHHYAPVRATL